MTMNLILMQRTGGELAALSAMARTLSPAQVAVSEEQLSRWKQCVNELWRELNHERDTTAKVREELRLAREQAQAQDEQSPAPCEPCGCPPAPCEPIGEVPLKPDPSPAPPDRLSKGQRVEIEHALKVCFDRVKARHDELAKRVDGLIADFDGSCQQQLLMTQRLATVILALKNLGTEAAS